jgi:hypothetical protein
MPAKPVSSEPAATVLAFLLVFGLAEGRFWPAGGSRRGGPGPAGPAGYCGFFG